MTFCSLSISLRKRGRLQKKRIFSHVYRFPLKCTGPLLFASAIKVNFHVQAYITTKIYLYNFDPLKPHFYIVKLGFTGVYIIFLISAQKHIF